jgi:hypothetical protein
LENERNLFEAQLADLQGNFNAVEADRLARGQAIETQGQLITELQGEVDTRLKELNAVYERSNALENERNLLQEENKLVLTQLQASESDREYLYSNKIVKLGRKIGLIRPMIK